MEIMLLNQMSLILYEIQKTHAFWKPLAPVRLAGFALFQGVYSVYISPLGNTPEEPLCSF